MIVKELITLKDKDDLEELEKEIVKTCLLEYLRTIRKYQVMDVTLEIDLDKRNKKIEEYNLTEEELTQAEKIKNEMQSFVKIMVYYKQEVKVWKMN